MRADRQRRALMSSSLSRRALIAGDAARWERLVRQSGAKAN